MSETDALFQAVAAARETEVLALVRERLSAGVSPLDILAECNRGMIELGNRFAAGECFLPDLMFGGMIMKQVMAELKPHLGAGPEKTAHATVALGTVEHDVHDIGKDIVATMLRGAGFEVIDLGVDVPPQRFVEAIRQYKPRVVGMSVLLTTCFKSVIATVEAIRTAGLRDSVAVMVGGAAAGPLLAEKAGCDFYGKTAVDGVKYAASLVGLA